LTGSARADILDNITLAWLTNTALSGARVYWEYRGKGAAELDGAGVSQAHPLEGSRRDFLRWNHGLPAPPEPFFLEH